MTKIQRSAFLQEMQNKSIDVEQAQGDANLGQANVARADLNNDGKIQGREEMDKLFLQMDNFDRDGSYQSMRIVDANGNQTRPGALVESARSLATEGSTASSLWINGGQIDNTNPERVREAAMTLVEERAENYGVQDPWYNLDPNHALPANVRLGGLKGSWKCNLFAGNTIQQAGFEPPYYGNRGRGEYPNANQMYKWSDKYAGQYGNKTHFEMVGELDVQSVQGNREERINQLLENAQIGDLIIVDHMGDDVADGGHCRVLVGKNPDGTYEFAQASHDAALVRTEGASRLSGEESIWILRPNRPLVE